jgi:hypothetical protein
MSTLVESLKRLYPTSQVVKDRVEGMYSEGKLTEEEYNYIIG